MRFFPALAALLALSAACRKAEAPKADLVPTRAVVAGTRLIDFDEQSGAFACRAPAEWKALEAKDGGPLVMFFGPSGAAPGAASISVSRYPDGVDRIKTPKDYWDSLRLTDRNPSAFETRQIGGRTAYATHFDVPQYPPHGRKVLYMNREDAVLIPGKDGFFEISHRAPADAYRQTLPVFDAVVESFQPKS